MNEQVQDLASQETDEQENQVQDGEDNSQTEGEAPEGTEAEGSEAEGSKDEESESGGESGQEASKSQRDKKEGQFRISNRIRQLRGDLSQSEAGKQNFKNQLAIANQRIEILQLANNQKRNATQPVEPSPNDFEEGVHDPKYIKKFQEYLRAENQQEIKREVETQTKSTQETVNNGNLQRETERKQRDHYRKALQGNSDYEEKEDAAKDILGVESIKDIIANFDDSDLIIYQLGADEDMAWKVADAMENKDHVLAVRLLERASRGLKPKPKTNKPTPNPDTPLPGGSPTAVTGFEAKRLKMLEKAQKTDDQSIYSDFMDEHRTGLKAEKAKYLPW